MATPLTCNFSLAYNDGVSSPISLQIIDFLATIAGKPTFRGQQTIAVTETTLNLGSITSLGYYAIVNLDPTNYVELKTASAGTIINRLDPAGGFVVGKWGSGITAPVLIANTLACEVDVILFSL